MSEDESGYEVGFGAVAESLERQAASRSEFYDYYSWSEDEKKAIRLLQLPVNTYWHERVMCTDGRRRDFIHTEKGIKNTRPCIFCAGQILKPDGNKYTVTERAVAIAALRKQKYFEKGGMRLPNGMMDTRSTHSESGDGQQFVGIIKQSSNNFWGRLSGHFARTKSITNVDFEVHRVGRGYDTQYDFTALEQDPELDTDEKLADHYKEILADKPTIFEWIESQATEEYFDKHLVAKTDTERENLKRTESIRSNDSRNQATQSQETKVSTGVQAPQDTNFSSLKSQLESSKSGNMDDFRKQLKGYVESDE